MSSLRGRIVTFATLCLLGGAAWACASIMHGTSQEVGISSQPTGATITIDGQPMGVTPVAARLRRKDTHTIRITMDGYQPFEVVTTRKTSGWVWGNIVFGGLIGLVVDFSNGAAYSVKPEEIASTLASAHSNIEVRDGMLYVILVPEADPSWEKIGQLKPIR